jgi:hypothetical protein
MSMLIIDASGLVAEQEPGGRRAFPLHVDGRPGFEPVPVAEKFVDPSGDLNRAE